TVVQAAIKTEKDTSRHDRFIVTLAEVRVLQQKTRDAVALAGGVLKTSTDPGIMFLAGRVLAEGGDATAARDIASRLSQRLDTDSQVYADLLEGELALHQNEARSAIEKFKAAQQITDTWL